jgi:hypothetical protein
MAFTRASVEHQAYNMNAEFANFSPCRRVTEGPISASKAGFGFAIGDCAYDLYMQRDIPAAVIVAFAIVNVIRRRAANSVSQKWNGADLSTRFRAEMLKWCARR